MTSIQVPTLDAATAWEIIAVRYGTRSTTRSSVFLHYEIYEEPDAAIGMDYYFWILRRGPEVILVDAGFTEPVGTRRGRRTVLHPVEALSLLGVEASQVHTIVATHGHYDHIGNLREFPAATVTMARREFEFWTGPLGRRQVFMASAEEDEIAHLVTLRDRGALNLVEEVYLVRDGVELIEVGGHTPGQLVVRVDTAAGPVVLASDAAHYYEELERDRPFAHVVDAGRMYVAFDQLRDLAEHTQAVIVPGQDPLVMARFPRCSGPLSEHAVQIA